MTADGARSYLYVPGDRPEMLAKAGRRGADALLVDLEDAVAPARKATARATVADWLVGPDRPNMTPIWVRVNPGAAGLADIAALRDLPVTGFCLAKADSVAEVAQAAAQLDPAGPVRLMPMIESAGGLRSVYEIAAIPEVYTLQIGEADLAADLGAEPGPDGVELLFARSQVVLACAAARIEPPVAAVAADFRDLDQLAVSTAALRRLGFRSRAAIHPGQLPVINAAFTPTTDEATRAADLIRRYDAVVARGGAVYVDDAGAMVDEAIVRAARRTVAIAARQSSPDLVDR